MDISYEWIKTQRPKWTMIMTYEKIHGPNTNGMTMAWNGLEYCWPDETKQGMD